MMQPECLKIFDVNLRQTFYSKDIIGQSLAFSNVLKLSDEELPVLAEMFGINGSMQKQLCTLVDKFELKLIAYTRGPEGSLLVAPDEISNHPGCPGAAVNSVGAGDSFTASMCVRLLKGKSLDEINEHANRVATFVCSKDGATPVLPAQLLEAGEYASQ
jgi:fructokinase